MPSKFVIAINHAPDGTLVALTDDGRLYERIETVDPETAERNGFKWNEIPGPLEEPESGMGQFAATVTKMQRDITDPEG